MKRILRRGAAALGVALLALIAWALPYGPLFPWSPWKPGYERLALRRADVYYPAGTELPGAYREIDRYIVESEAFHRYSLPSRIRVIRCRDWGAVRRFLPQLGGARVGAAVLATGTVLYVSPILDEKGLDHAEFLRHELSHATLHQHQGLIQAYRVREAQPLFEGLAVSFGRQRAYVTTEAFVDHARAHDLDGILDTRLRPPGASGSMRLNYQVWRFFLEWLIDTRGRDAFQGLLDRAMRDPGRYPVFFAEVYGEDLSVAIRSFAADIRAGGWHPRE